MIRYRAVGCAVGRHEGRAAAPMHDLTREVPTATLASGVLAPIVEPGQWLADVLLGDGSRLTVQLFGDNGVLAQFGGGDRAATWANVQGVARVIRASDAAPIRTVVATYDTVFVEFDLDKVGCEDIARLLVQAGEHAPFAPPLPRHRVSIPVVYGDRFGPDLDALADELNVEPEEIVAAHSSGLYTVRTVVSPPGAPMLDAPALTRGVSRLAAPRAAVPAGSVAVAGRQSTVYATSSPGGWRLIGRTPTRLLEVTDVEPLIQVGDLIEFVAVAASAWDDFVGRRPQVRRA